MARDKTIVASTTGAKPMPKRKQAIPVSVIQPASVGAAAMPQAPAPLSNATRADLKHGSVATVEQFVEQVGRLNSSNGVLWFRGISSEQHQLTPSLHRRNDGKQDDELRRVEAQLNRRFRDKSLPHNSQGHRDESTDTTPLQSWWRMFTMQHYGMPTRLLDWSENALIALCFAVFGAKPDPQEDAVVWVLDPCTWNHLGNANHQHPLSVDEHGAEPYTPLPSKSQNLPSEWPLAIYGMHNSPRIVTQQGTFVVFAPGKTASMEAFALEGKKGLHALRAIHIARDSIHPIAQNLRKLGFVNSSLYPDLFGLSIDLKKDFGY